MVCDVTQLQAFYTQTPAGRLCKRLLSQRVQELWRDTVGLQIVGLGYPTPLLDGLAKQCLRMAVMMPAQQGVMAWPAGNVPQQSCLVDPRQLPLPDMSVDRLLVVHLLEGSRDMGEVLDECWRTLSISGRMLVIVAARRGWWVQSEATPFGYGQPFTPRQLRQLLQQHRFQVMRSDTALHAPPNLSRFSLKLVPMWEDTARKWAPALAGVLLMECSKQLHTPLPLQTRARQPSVAMPGIVPV